MLRGRNLAAFLVPVQLAMGCLAGCEHAAPSARTGQTQEVEESTFTARWRAPDVPAPGGPALLIVGEGVAPGFSARLATAAMEAGVSTLELRTGDPGQALLWLGPRARRLFVSAAADNVASAAALVASGRVAGLVLFTPPSLPVGASVPTLVIRGGAPASKQSGQQWEVRFPDLDPARKLSEDDEHSILEMVALWLRARADES